MASEILDQMLRRADLVWRPGERRVPTRAGLPTGYAVLDSVLRESGWPRGALVELLSGQAGIGELRLLLPVLAAMSASGLYQIWIDPPCLPYAPGLAMRGIDFDRLVVMRPGDHKQWLWATEQALRSPGCGAVLCWAGSGRSRYAELRKLQVAAAERGCVGFVFANPKGAESASPAALRLKLSASLEGLTVEVVKQRGAASGQRVLLETPATLRKQVPLRERPTVVSAPRLPKRTPRHGLPFPCPVQLEVWQ